MPKFEEDAGDARQADRERLARFVWNRRKTLNLTQNDVASRGGPSTQTLRLIEAGAPAGYRQKSLRQLDAVLGWREGSAARTLAGGEPQVLCTPQAAVAQAWDDREAGPILPADVRRGLGLMIDRAAS